MRETHPGSALESDEDSDDSGGSPQVSPATRAAAHASFDGFDVSERSSSASKAFYSLAISVVITGCLPGWSGIR